MAGTGCFSISSGILKLLGGLFIFEDFVKLKLSLGQEEAFIGCAEVFEGAKILVMGALRYFKAQEHLKWMR